MTSEPASPPRGIDFPLYAFVRRTRTSQKISKISGSTVRTKYKVVLNKAGDGYFPSPTVESNLSGRFDPPKKNDPAAINSPKHKSFWFMFALEKHVFMRPIRDNNGIVE